MSSLCLAPLVSLPVWVIFLCYIIMELCLFGEYSVIHACNSASRINASVDSKCCCWYSFPCLTTPLTVSHIGCVRSDAQNYTQTRTCLVTQFTFILPYRILCGQNRVVFSASIYCPSALCQHPYWDVLFSNERLPKTGFCCASWAAREGRYKPDANILRTLPHNDIQTYSIHQTQHKHRWDSRNLVV